MRKEIPMAALTVALALAMPQLCRAQETRQSAQASQPPDKAAPQGTKGAAQTVPAKNQSLADAARKARAAEKNAPKAGRVFTNDNIPTSSTGVSVVGTSAPPSDQSVSAPRPLSSEQNDEAAWRQKFADARHKIEQDKQELSVMQRELGELNVQYYNDPTKAMAQSYSRSDIVGKQKAIDTKQKQLDADEQALANLEDELRKAGGDPGWARE